MVLGLVEGHRGRPTDLSLEMLTFARLLATNLGVPLEAVLIGGEGRALAGAVGRYGAGVVHLAGLERLDDYAPEAWAETLVQLVASAGPIAVVAPGSDRGNEVMAHAAARMDLPMAANCIEVRPGDPWVVTRARWGGSLLEEAGIEGVVKLLTVAPHAVAPEASEGSGEPRMSEFKPELSEADFRVTISDRVERTAGRVSLPDARVVVGGGRGVGGPDWFAVLEELAELLGGSVGCSRVVTSLGWRPHSDQIGQTGTRIAPDLYIACGISGAIQHIVGCKGAKRILAINSDPQAPILAQADYAVIGDLRQVVPAVNAALKKARSSSG